MSYEIWDCIDAGSEFCPCHLAEQGECLLCSQLNGKNFCDCLCWKGVCIYQEFIWNGNKAKRIRESYNAEILKVEAIEKKIYIFTLALPQRLIKSLQHPGAYVFVKKDSNDNFFDIPISVMDINIDDSTLKIAIEIKGIKTKKLTDLKEKDNLIIRGPYWNGIHGVRNIFKARDGKCLLIARGIGLAPMVPVLKKLYGNGNEIIAVLDYSPYNTNYVKDYLELCNVEAINMKIMEKGELTQEFIDVMLKISGDKKLNLVHCDGADKMSHDILSLLSQDIPFSCCNNAKMCCGEGICGSCVVKTQDRKQRRLCKLQTEAKYILEGRRLF